MVAQGAFRHDLYYRIARIVLEVPPLRARADDMSVLADHFLRELAPSVGRKQLSRDALARYDRNCANGWNATGSC